MFLKSLVLRGFKSFADKTTLAFEPGISVVVGPNGSGKSNVVDAICWVLGEQGPAALRGGKMEDVIFAGSAAKPPLGMAEVELTIDNTAGLLPVEFSEVTIGRTLFRSGDSEYRMNGSACRLLDIQEMLSDAGVGRDQHTIVGQGRLDEVLSADPVQMRNIIEDSAGVGKHRRRKERALRKIAATENNLEHLGDLLSEIRRQLKPLRQQAEIAARHDSLRDELRRIRLILTARQMAGLEAELESVQALEQDDLLQEGQRQEGALESRLADLEESRLAQREATSGQRDLEWRTVAALERLEACRRLAEERGLRVRAELSAASEDVEQARLVELRRQEAELEAAVEDARRRQDTESAVLARVQPLADLARDDLRAAEQRLTAALRDHAEASAQASGLRREIAGVRAAAEGAGAERNRLAERRRDAALRNREIAARLESVRRDLEEAAASREGEAAASRAAEQSLQELIGLRERLLEETRSLEKKVAVLRARAGARREAEARRDVAGTSVRSHPDATLLPQVAELAPGHRRALEVLVGPLSGVLVAPDREAAARVLQEADQDEALTVMVAEPSGLAVEGALPLVDQVGVLDPQARRVLADVYLVASLQEAVRLAGRYRHAVFLSADGSVAHGGLVSKGSAELASAVHRCDEQVAAARAAMKELDAQVAQARTAAGGARSAQARAEKACDRAAEQVRAAEREAHRVEAEIAEIDAASVRSGEADEEASTRSGLLQEQVREAEAELEQRELALSGAREERDRLARAYEEHAQRSEAARMSAGIADERVRQYLDRLRRVVAALSDSANRLSGLGQRQEALLGSQRKLAQVASGCEVLAGPVAGWLGEIRQTHQEALEAGRQIDRQITELRERRREAAERLEQLRAGARRQDLARSEMLIRYRILEATLTDDLEAEPVGAVARWGHRREVPDSGTEDDPMLRAATLPDEALRKRQGRLERDLEQMGRVNPLAAQEAEGLAEREGFLEGQVNDLRASRKDLHQVVASVETKIRELFATAFEDIAAEYTRLFGVLFPSGRGRLRLTDPGELLESGVEVQASPSGKNLKRLSLLSGGERALSALALLFAIFRARPSPFYILDEVEAALDDVNLQRFLSLLDEFRGTSQLLVVTHQKRTMEIADVLYGVSMRPDGVTKVISERLKDFFPAPVPSPGSSIGVD